MDFMLLMLGIVLGAVICAARSIVTGRKQPRTRPVKSPPMLYFDSKDTGHARFKHKRELQSISIKECETLIHASEGVLFVSVNETGDRRPLPFHNMYALVMTPRQLACEIRWFPSDTCVVLYGDVSLCCSALGLLENVPEIPPIYMLRDNQSRWGRMKPVGETKRIHALPLSSLPEFGRPSVSRSREVESDVNHEHSSYRQVLL
jgi:hypothetical protein